MSSEARLGVQHHGKSRVRVARTWRLGDVHVFVEYNVFTMLESPMDAAYYKGDNTGMTATDTQKNTVYVVAQRMTKPCTPEEFGVALAQHFVRTYPLVTKAKVLVEQKPWVRLTKKGVLHDHGFTMAGTETRTAYVTYDKQNKLEVTAGVRELQVLKTTQSGYEGFLRCQYTTLPESSDRILATSITANWKYTTQPADYEAAYQAAKAAIVEGFFGPCKGGVYSPSVQMTLYDMGKQLLAKVPQVDSVFFNAPNLHFIPVAPVTSTFNNDVYLATSEPHGNIECVVTRGSAAPHCKL